MATKPAKPAAAKKDAPAPKAEDAAPPPKNSKKLIVIIAVLLLIIAGGGGFFYMKMNKAGQTQEVKKELPKEPKFIPLDAFTVNLQREESAEQFLQIGITFKTFEPEFEEKVKLMLPEIRSKLNLLLSSKRPSELATVAGKRKLATDIMAEANHVLGIQNAPASEHAAAPAPAPPVASAAAPTDGAHEKSAEGEAAKSNAEAASGAEAAPGTEAASSTEAASAPGAETAAVAPAPAPVAAPAVESEKKGIVDVLFTSFIIQ